MRGPIVAPHPTRMGCIGRSCVLITQSPYIQSLHVSMLLTLLFLTLQAAPFAADAPSGTGLEWMTLSSVVIPALLLAFLVYQGNKQTVG